MFRRCALFGLLLLAVVGCGGGKPRVKLQGAGASFPAPLYTRWFKEFSDARPGVTVDYQSIGSGGGVKAVIDKTVDFGASDAAMTDDEVNKVDRGVVMLPLTAGKVVLAYNLEGVKDLKLPREAYAGIFLGKITKWNDPVIARANPGVTLPDAKINVVVRADSSGTTYVFTKHLAAISPDFARSPGVNKAPNWPVGIKSKGNEGVTASLKTTPGSIGYVEYGYARSPEVNLPMALLENKEGQFVAPTIAAGQAALATAQFPDNLIAWVPDPAGKDSYPIVTYTWLLLYKNYDDPARLEAVKELVTYCLDKGQKEAEELGYLPLPPSVVEKTRAALGKLSLAEKVAGK